MRFLIALVLAMLCGAPAIAQQGGPGYLDPQRVVTQTLTAACSTASCPVTFVLATGYSVCSASVTGTFSATVSFEQSVDGSNWSAWYLTPNSGGSTVATTTAAFFGSATMLGVTYVRARVSAYTSGGATVGIYCAPVER